MTDHFARAFHDGTGGFDPYPWQRTLALSDELAPATDAPTAAGKTEGILFAWLWRRRLADDPNLSAQTPRRLAIALPMRVLVEQTRDRIAAACERLTITGRLDPDRPVRVQTLMGGEAEDDWSLHPADDQILVGTVDMLLSRALNRGYGRSRGRWPLDFGLLNTDTLWAFDEVQLLDAALSTSCQLAAFRADATFGAEGAPGGTLWMSATMDRDWLETTDHQAPSGDRIVSVGPDDEAHGLRERLNAAKGVERVELDPHDAKALAEVVLDCHAAARPPAGEPSWLTIALCNTVDRARRLYDVLARMALEPELVLLHSRFRPADREAALARATAVEVKAAGRVVVTTQVIEAGVDLDAAAIVSELAPWASFVQRAGRLNRRGRRRAAVFTWVDPPPDALEKVAPPYEPDALAAARDGLLELPDGNASPNALRVFAASKRRSGSALLAAPRRGLLLRRPDLVELFDTDPTLDGDDAEIGQYIRLGEDLDVQVAWRSFEEPPGPTEPAASRAELCPVPIGDRKELDRLGARRWSYPRRRWERAFGGGREVAPGDVLLLPCSAGGYTADRGWEPRAKTPVDPIDPQEHRSTVDSDAHDPETDVGEWLTIAAHTDHVVAAVREDVARLSLAEQQREALLTAARYHDAGKAHPSFQERLGVSDDPTRLWAKSATARGPRPRSVFRHEVASVLLALADRGEPEDRTAELILYLVGAHHGKLRLVPRMSSDGHAENGQHSCLGVREGMPIPGAGIQGPIELGDGVVVAPLTEPKLDCFALGSPNAWTWTESALALRDHFGAFGLAYLEALIVAADCRASAMERRRA